jgi:DNA-binding CsgD family transcriptional regulator
MIDREEERARVASFFDAAGSGTHALLLHGEAGIGKTTLWQAALDQARARGYRVAVTRPTEAEARLPFAGLNDLLGEIAPRNIERLAGPQRHALDVALMRTEVTDAPIQPLALSLAVLELLRLAASVEPVALAIDDVQWLDESTAGVLRFALRRIEGDPVILIATQRTQTDPPPMPPVVADLPANRIDRLPVGGLASDAVEALLDQELGLRLSPRALVRVHNLSAGSPLHALEIGRVLQARGMDGTEERLPIPPSLDGLVRERLAALTDDARAVVELAAAVSQPTPALLQAVLGSRTASDGLSAARMHGILAGNATNITFTHPLLAAEAYAAIDAEARRELHRRIASAVTEPEELARHLALASTGPEAAVATALDHAAAHAHRRGAPDAAADLAELAAGLTPAEAAERVGRIAAAGRYRLMAGDVARARQLLEDALDAPAAATGSARAELLLALATVRQLMDDFVASASLGREALRVSGDDRALRIRIKLLLAGASHITGDDWSGGARHASEAMHLAEGLGDAKVLAGTIGHYASWRYATGHGADPDLERRAAELEAAMGELRTLDRPDYDFAAIDFLEGHTAQAAARVRRLLDRAETDGDYSSLPFLLGNAALYDWLDGDATKARERLDRGARLAEVTEQGAATVHNLAYRARVEARLGDADAARDAAHRAFDLMASTSWRIGEWAVRADLALVELSRGDPAAALGVVAGSIDPSVRDPSGRRHWAQAVAIESLVALGRHDEAGVVLAALERQAGRRGAPPRLLAEASRARARVAAATGDAGAARTAIERAEQAFRVMDDPWELARTLLLAGEIHRRSRRRARARAALSEALEAFEHLGAASWAVLAREQLGRTGVAREADGLTPTQREVAELAAQGLTNRQVGDRLFMSPHTVEAHLSAVYRSLGIRSRAALDAALVRGAAATRDTSGGIRDSRPALAARI